jgi:hypothetical protein
MTAVAFVQTILDHIVDLVGINKEIRAGGLVRSIELGKEELQRGDALTWISQDQDGYAMHSSQASSWTF